MKSIQYVKFVVMSLVTFIKCCKTADAKNIQTEEREEALAIAESAAFRCLRDDVEQVWKVFLQPGNSAFRVRRCVGIFRKLEKDMECQK